MNTMPFTKPFLLTAIILFCQLPLAADIFMSPPHEARHAINRKAVVTRHNPHITNMDTLASLTVGNGTFAVTVDGTGLQTFPKYYSHGVLLGTMADWGWHNFTNTMGYESKDVWQTFDFGRGHKEVYAVQPKDGRGKAAADWLCANPHRLHLGTMGFNFDSPDKITDIDETLDLWTGCVESRFCYSGQPFHVQTVSAPDKSTMASRIESGGRFTLKLSLPYPTGNHSDDACDWTSTKHSLKVCNLGNDHIVFEHILDSIKYYVIWSWRGKARLKKSGKYNYELRSMDKALEVYVNYSSNEAEVQLRVERPFSDFKLASAGAWAEYWETGRFLDFGSVCDPRATELERRMVLSMYLMNAQEHGSMPPQETGLTYNSWFGKFHLEMAWWHLAHWAMWGHLSRLDKPLSWYVRHIDQARGIARRQGFKGIRWMKMTDPLAGEAPSNIGSFLIWQQPEPIILAELIYQGANETERKLTLKKYGDMVDETAEFMGDFVQRDFEGNYHLCHYIPAQETLNKDSVVDSPLELSEWHYALGIAQQWRQRRGLARRADWDSIIARIVPLACNADSLYLASATTPNSFTYKKYFSDHPAVLGAYGMMPPSRLVNPIIMRKTVDWVFDNWNWPSAWGWDFPMMAMTYARLGDGEKAIESLLMDTPKNTYLPNGHNWQSQVLRVYMPGNSGLLAALALMADLQVFPKDWTVEIEE